jgi:ribosomal protein L37AE/L43A
LQPISERVGRLEKIQQEQAGRECDFCGDRVAAVRRVALDREYDRLQKAHRELYSCPVCFESKERERLGLERR